MRADVLRRAAIVGTTEVYTNQRETAGEEKNRKTNKDKKKIYRLIDYIKLNLVGVFLFHAVLSVHCLCCWCRCGFFFGGGGDGGHGGDGGRFAATVTATAIVVFFFSLFRHFGVYYSTQT